MPWHTENAVSCYYMELIDIYVLICILVYYKRLIAFIDDITCHSYKHIYLVLHNIFSLWYLKWHYRNKNTSEKIVISKAVFHNDKCLLFRLLVTWENYWVPIDQLPVLSL